MVRVINDFTVPTLMQTTILTLISLTDLGGETPPYNTETLVHAILPSILPLT